MQRRKPAKKPAKPRKKIQAKAFRDKRGRFRKKPKRDALGRFAKVLDAINQPKRGRDGQFLSPKPRDKLGRFTKKVFDAEKIILDAELKAAAILEQAQKDADEIRIKSLIDAEWKIETHFPTELLNSDYSVREQYAKGIVGDLMRAGYGPDDLAPNGTEYYLELSAQTGIAAREIFTMFKSPHKYGISA